MRRMICGLVLAAACGGGSGGGGEDAVEPAPCAECGSSDKAGPVACVRRANPATAETAIPTQAAPATTARTFFI